VVIALHEPTAGAILLDGIDLREWEYDPKDIRRMFSIVFQDFVRYDMSLRDNVGIGNYADPDPQQIRFAVMKADADVVVKRLPNGYDQMLSRRFEDGVDLSGCEWQKVAVARASMCHALVVILDEPTANFRAGSAESEGNRRCTTSGSTWSRVKQLMRAE
jgi:ATP-binding cassette, subfamily B, bacterial